MHDVMEGTDGRRCRSVSALVIDADTLRYGDGYYVRAPEGEHATAVLGGLGDLDLLDRLDVRLVMDDIAEHGFSERFLCDAVRIGVRIGFQCGVDHACDMMDAALDEAAEELGGEDGRR